MKKFLSIGFSTIASLLLIFAILFTSMELTINNQTFIENEFTDLSISKTMGISNSDLVKSTMRLIDYMQGDVPDINVDVTLNGVTTPMFALEQEHTHMKDVQQIYLTIKQYRDYSVLAMLVLFLFAAVINFKKAQQTLAQGYLSGAFIALLFIGFIGTWAISDFSSFWTFFHEALFWNDLWLFDATESRMINMLPEPMFSAIVGRIFLFAGLAIAALIAASVLALVFSSKSYKKKRAESIKRQRARKAAIAAASKARAEARLAAKTAREQAKAEREKAKRLEEKRKAKEKAQRKKGKKGAKPAAESSVQALQKQAAAETETAEATLADGMPSAYAEDEDGYPAENSAETPVGDGEVASIDDILRARKKPWRAEAPVAPEAAPAIAAPTEEEAPAPEETVEYAILTKKGYIPVDADAPEPEDDPFVRRDSGRTPRPADAKKPRAKKPDGILSVKKTLAKAAKARREKPAPKEKKQRGNVRDDTGFFDE